MRLMSGRRASVCPRDLCPFAWPIGVRTECGMTLGYRDSYGDTVAVMVFDGAPVQLARIPLRSWGRTRVGCGLPVDEV